MHRFLGVARHLRATLDLYAGTPELHAFLEHLLLRSGRAFDPDRSGGCSSFLIEICGALGGNLAAASIAGAAVECAMAASDVVDDMIDEPQLPDDARLQINAALALSQLSQCCLHGLADLVGAERAHRASMLLAQGSLTSSAGQDLDLRFEQRTDVDEDQAHHMTQLKSGSLLTMACQIGAAIALDDADVLAQIGEFGRHVGIAEQLLNDIAGIDYRRPKRGSDLALRKKTLPVSYALRCAEEEDIAALREWARTGGPLAPEHEQRLAELMHRLGALHYTWVVADVHRREALALVRQIARATRRPQVARLRRLVPALRAQKPQ